MKTKDDQVTHDGAATTNLERPSPPSLDGSSPQEPNDEPGPSQNKSSMAKKMGLKAAMQAYKSTKGGGGSATAQVHTSSVHESS